MRTKKNLVKLIVIAFLACSTLTGCLRDKRWRPHFPLGRLAQRIH